MHNFAFTFLYIMPIYFCQKSNFKLYFILNYCFLPFIQLYLIKNWLWLKEDDFMEQLQHHGITGTVPKHVLSDNMKNFTAFPLSAPADDGFIHLLGKGICSFPNHCSMTFRINAPYHFFYVYEGTLSVTDEHHTCRLADRHANSGRSL